VALAARVDDSLVVSSYLVLLLPVWVHVRGFVREGDLLGGVVHSQLGKVSCCVYNPLSTYV
jgi:hypothetical protein